MYKESIRQKSDNLRSEKKNTMNSINPLGDEFHLLIKNKEKVKITDPKSSFIEEFKNCMDRLHLMYMNDNAETMLAKVINIFKNSYEKKIEFYFYFENKIKELSIFMDTFRGNLLSK